MASIQDIIKRKQAEIAAKKAQSLKTIKPQAGKHTYRILPGWRVDSEGERDPQFWHDFGMHWIKENKDAKPMAVYICTEKTFGEDHPCPICATIGKGIGASRSDEHIENLKGCNAGQRYLLNVLHRSAAEADMREVPQALEIGGQVFEQLCEFVAEYGDITNLKEGIDLIIKREGSGFDTTYTVLPAKSSKPVKAEVLEKLNNLDAFVAQESKPALAKALTAIGTVARVSPATSTALPSAPKAELLEHIDEDMPEEFGSDSAEESTDNWGKEDCKEDSKGEPEDLMSDLDDLDELDELLAEA